MRKRKFPNLFIVGAPKSGTTSLAHWLSEHPDIFFLVGGRKDTKIEPHYWAKDIESHQKLSEKEYFEIFDNVDSIYKYAGEASVWYLFSKEAINNIEKYIKNPKYIVCVRNPVEMAYSLWLQQIKDGLEFEKENFLKAFNLSEERRKGNFIKANQNLPLIQVKGLDYKNACAIGTQLEKLFNVVSRERVLVIVLDDLKRNPRREWLRIMNFLHLKDDGRSFFDVHNKKKIPRNTFVHRFYIKALEISAKTYRVRETLKLTKLGVLKKLRDFALKDGTNFKISEEEKKELFVFFREEIEKLEKLLGRNFDEWKQ